MNILIVTAHPSSKGFTHKLGQKYSEGVRESSREHEIEILDLYTTDLQQDFLKFEDPHEMNDFDPVKKKLQEKISWAHEIVIIHPLWWFDAPAILKNWFDQNFTSGFAYRYTKKTKVMPLKLLKGKIARIFITCDGPGWFYWFVRPFKTSWVLGRLGFCGIKVKTFRLFAGKVKKPPEVLEKWLQEAYETGKKTH